MKECGVECLKESQEEIDNYIYTCYRRKLQHGDVATDLQSPFTCSFGRLSAPWYNLWENPRLRFRNGKHEIYWTFEYIVDIRIGPRIVLLQECYWMHCNIKLSAWNKIGSHRILRAKDCRRRRRPGTGIARPCRIVWGSIPSQDRRSFRIGCPSGVVRPRFVWLYQIEWLTCRITWCMPWKIQQHVFRTYNKLSLLSE
jgi:hypothetical protein